MPSLPDSVATVMEVPLIAVYHHPLMARRDMRDALLRRGVTPREIDGAALLSSDGLSMVAEPGKTAHVTAPLSSVFQKAHILPSSVPMPDDDGAAAFLGWVLRHMGPGAELEIDLCPDAGAKTWWLTPESLAARLPSCRLVQAKDAKSWCLCAPESGLGHDLRQLKSRVHACRADFAGFRRTMECHGRRFEDPKTNPSRSAELVFAYSLQRVLPNAFVFERICRAAFGARRLRLLDMGGGFGFLGCEMAAKGHRVMVQELGRDRVATGKTWLRPLLGLDQSVEYCQGRMEDFEGPDETYDLISFWGSLLLCDRGKIDQVLRRALRMLKPDGVLLVEERPLVKGRSEVPTLHPFQAAELDAILRSAVGVPTYVCGRTGRRFPFAEASRSVMLAVAAKDGRKLAIPRMPAEELLRLFFHRGRRRGAHFLTGAGR